MSTARVIPFTSDSVENIPVVERYREAYQTAEEVTGFAETVKLCGIFLAGLIFVAAVVVYQSIPAERSGFPVTSAWLIAGAVLVILASHLWSMVFRIQAWMLEVAIDSAVNSSPLLSNAQRARVKSWPNGAAHEEESAA
ncbi:MAG: hypothetical protein LAO18_06035 [Acidobacteriia bacterium]|jgi:uncharacterized membrane protein|nr:hypothetical protein [Terriglobia bacterium]